MFQISQTWPPVILNSKHVESSLQNNQASMPLAEDKFNSYLTTKHNHILRGFAVNDKWKAGQAEACRAQETGQGGGRSRLPYDNLFTIKNSNT